MQRQKSSYPWSFIKQSSVWLVYAFNGLCIYLETHLKRTSKTHRYVLTYNTRNIILGQIYKIIKVLLQQGEKPHGRPTILVSIYTKTASETLAKAIQQRSVVYFLCGQASYSPSKTVTLPNVASPTPLWKKLMSVELAYQDLRVVSCWSISHKKRETYRAQVPRAKRPLA